MVTKKENEFHWLRQEIDSIKSERFHIFEPIGISCFDGSIPFPEDFSEFLREFGYSRLFTDFFDAPELSVYPLESHRKYFCKNGEVFWGFGFSKGQSVYFKEAELLVGDNCGVYTVSKKFGKLVANSFSEWLNSAYVKIKNGYSKRAWMEILGGPPPFSIEQLHICKVRKMFSYKLIGSSEDGDAKIMVKNGSKSVIPYLTVGVRGMGGTRMTGAVWIPVGDLLPDTEVIVSLNCYKDQIPVSELELFDLPDPIPEKADLYREFAEVE